MNDQFELVHGDDEFVVLITVSITRNHVWGAMDKEAADTWVNFWNRRGAETTVMTMREYRENNEDRLPE